MKSDQGQTMAWNGSNRNDRAKTLVSPAATASKPSLVRGVVAGLVVISISVSVLFMLYSRSESRKDSASANRGRVKAIPGVSPSAAPTGSAQPSALAKIKAELNDKVREFVKRADTNNVIRLGPAPLDPDDPDNALRTQTMTEVAMLVGIEPGEPMPPVPFSFMMEDDAIKAAAESGERLVVMDGGNSRFKEEMKKWKITIKETDSEQRAAKKQELLESQLELLRGIDDGISVNDSIRAAYEFRKRAYEVRTELLNTISELHAEDPDVDITKELVRRANEKLAADGIKKISYSDVMPDYDGEENPVDEEENHEEEEPND